MEGFSDPRIMALLGAGSGLLQASAPSPVPMSFSGAMGNAFPAALQGAQAAYGFQGQEMLRKRMQDEALQRIEAQEFLKNHQQQGTDPRALIQAAAISGNPQLMTMASTMQKAMPSVKTTEKVKGPDGRVYTRPIFTDGSRGDISDMEVAAPLQFQSTGKQLLGLDAYTGMPQTQYEQTTSPYQDQQLAQSDRHHANSMGMQRANLGLQQENAAFNRQLQAMQLDPGFQAQRAAAIAGGKAQGANQAQAAVDLPRTVQQGEQTIKLVDDLLNHPGFGLSVGKTAPAGSLAAMVPGTNAASFDIALNQLKGKQFLEAFESLKGGGSITETEGQKAQQAMSRMEKSNTEEEFTKASREFQGIIQQGINRAKSKAGQQPSFNDGWGDLR